MSEKITVRREDYDRMLNALRRIAKYVPPDKLRRDAERDRFGPHPDEMIEMAYENVIQEAKAGVRGVRNLPK